MRERHAVTRTRMKEPPTSLLMCDGPWPVLLFLALPFFLGFHAAAAILFSRE